MTSTHVHDTTPTTAPPPLTRPAVESILSQHGYRLTGPRAAIVDAMLAYDHPFTAEELVAALRTAGTASAPRPRPIGRATVYRTLEILASVDVLTRLIQADGHPAYIWDTPGHRHHVVCTSCGTAVTFTSCPVNQIVATLARETAFVIHDHMLEVFGLCPDCQKHASTNPPSHSAA